MVAFLGVYRISGFSRTPESRIMSMSMSMSSIAATATPTKLRHPARHSSPSNGVDAASSVFAQSLKAKSSVELLRQNVRSLSLPLAESSQTADGDPHPEINRHAILSLSEDQAKRQLIQALCMLRERDKGVFLSSLERWPS